MIITNGLAWLGLHLEVSVVDMLLLSQERTARARDMLLSRTEVENYNFYLFQMFLAEPSFRYS